MKKDLEFAKPKMIDARTVAPEEILARGESVVSSTEAVALSAGSRDGKVQAIGELVGFSYPVANKTQHHSSLAGEEVKNP